MKKSSVSGCECHTNSPLSFTTKSSLPLYTPTIFGDQWSEKVASFPARLMAASISRLLRLLSVSIQDMAVREHFIHPSHSSNRSSHSGSHMFAASSSRDISGSPRSNPPPPNSGRSIAPHSSPASASSAKPLSLNAGQKELVERTLGQYIGPMAKTLVRKEAARHGTTSALLQALAAHIDKPEDRSLFLQAIKGRL